MVSAIKKDGVPLYKLARQGKTVEREPRFVHVFGYEIKKVQLPEIDFRVVCSKGFYVRTYAFDIGERTRLRRASEGTAPHQIRAVHARARDHRGRAQDAGTSGHRQQDPRSADGLADAWSLSKSQRREPSSLRRFVNVLRSIADLGSIPGPLFLAIGVFDGVHLGHRAVIQRACSDAAHAGGQAVVVTFDPHPIRVLRPEQAPRLAHLHPAQGPTHPGIGDRASAAHPVR